MSSKKSTGRPTRKIITNHFIQDQKVQNSSNRYFYKCNYCSMSVEGRDDKPLKHILDRNTCPTAPDHARTEVRNYLATKNGNQALLLPPIVDALADSSSSPSGDTAKAPQKRKNLFEFVDLPVTPEQAIRANFNRFENEMLESRGSQEGTGEVPDIFKGDIIDWNELEKVDKGITPTGFVEEIDVVARGSQGMEPGWNINALYMLTSEGVAQ
ncbi:hypothetical protein P692DRAFT_20841214 [Suillus brevipes Sb2]|nr:hypothetical protein P692DRAFT_20841214 [Suillus brevipes Sb2]